MLHILAELEKGGRDRPLPVAPEFAEFLLATPECDRHGRVFRPLTRAGGVASPEAVCRTISRAGELAGVVVHRATKRDASGQERQAIKYASAHDCRRSFGERWAGRLMPEDLMVLMRHESIETTMRFYAGRSAETTADAVWAAYEKSAGSSGIVSGTVAPETTEEAIADHAATE